MLINELRRVLGVSTEWVASLCAMNSPAGRDVATQGRRYHQPRAPSCCFRKEALECTKPGSFRNSLTVDSI
jgi:hypothetical protein